MRAVKFSILLCALASLCLCVYAFAQTKTVRPVTEAMLLNPPPDDWLMYSRTYDAQRYSPLNQINKGNVNRLTEAWKKDLLPGTIEMIPIVHDGVMYVQ